MSMLKPEIKTANAVVPMIYAYSTPEIKRHNGWTKIGYTEQEVERRIAQQTHTADVIFVLEWQGKAEFDDGSGETFRDTQFHVYLRQQGIEQEEGKDNEWFHVDGKTSKQMFYNFREDRGILTKLNTVIPYHLRAEQKEAVCRTLAYHRANHLGKEYLWNAKPRFGKTLTVYDFIRRANAKTVLVVTNRPAVANAWYDDYARFMGPQSGYWFVSEVDALRGPRRVLRQGILTREQYTGKLSSSEPHGCIEFVSLQDMKGSLYFGGNYDKLKEVAELQWDILVIDEAHEGVDTYKTDVAFEHIKRKFTLHLSGTPFKALANSKFPDNAIYNWTYADEQKCKAEWNSCASKNNPYADMPRLNLFTYQMSEIICDKVRQGVDIEGETEEYAFDLNEFFAVNKGGKFKYGSSVDRFLDALTKQEKYPFSTEELRNELKHTFWLLNRVDSAKALANKLQEHPVFKDYHIILAAGDGRLDDAEETQKSYDKVIKAIQTYDKTITLSVGQLTTGVTVPEWTGVLMLSNVKSPSLYMQAAFRAQNPCLFHTGKKVLRKENAYVFDFDPARTLIIYEEFANDLCTHTAAGRGDAESRQANIRDLLNFFPVIGEDENGKLIELDAEKVLSIPRKIRAKEVVKRGFMSNFLFQNIGNIFSAPSEVVDIVNSFNSMKEPTQEMGAVHDAAKRLNLNKDGEVEVPSDVALGMARNIFGNKIYGGEKVTAPLKTMPPNHDSIAHVKKTTEDVVDNITEQVVKHYNGQVGKSEMKRIGQQLKKKAAHLIDTAKSNYDIKSRILDQKRREAQQNRYETGRTSEDIDSEYEGELQKIREEFSAALTSSLNNFVDDAAVSTVSSVETSIRKKEKASIEDSVRDHLRGFSRTIPSFLMAYGDKSVTLANFDSIIPDDVFKEVTGITLEQFRFLRDGGEYIDPETQETKTFGGQLFDPIVFNDSVKEFMTLKSKLANYFDEHATEDIFNYIPPQKTNQIFTPKEVVQRMVDYLEKENPGCFDDPNRTFADLYMKSGLYIAEIVKRLYRSKKMKKLYQDEEERLRHIFEHQVYGLAPTEIIYRIATNFILDFNGNHSEYKHHFHQLDAQRLAEEGILKQTLDKLYGK